MVTVSPAEGENVYVAEPTRVVKAAPAVEPRSDRGWVRGPPEGGGDVDAATEVGPGGVGQVQRSGHRTGCGHPGADRIGTGRGDVDRVPEPLATRGPAHVVPAAAVGRRLQVNAVGAVAVGG